MGVPEKASRHQGEQYLKIDIGGVAPRTSFLVDHYHGNPPQLCVSPGSSPRLPPFLQLGLVAWSHCQRRGRLQGYSTRACGLGVTEAVRSKLFTLVVADGMLFGWNTYHLTYNGSSDSRTFLKSFSWPGASAGSFVGHFPISSSYRLKQLQGGLPAGSAAPANSDMLSSCGAGQQTDQQAQKQTTAMPMHGDSSLPARGVWALSLSIRGG